jgi:hypothetical protein
MIRDEAISGQLARLWMNGILLPRRTSFDHCEKISEPFSSAYMGCLLPSHPLNDPMTDTPFA